MARSTAMMSGPLGRLTAMLLTLGISACAGTPANFAVWGPQSRPQPGYRAPLPPPPPQAESVSGQPEPGVVWTQGYWRWENNRYRWVEGHWEANRPHERWVGYRWEPEGNGQWKLEGGYWRRE